MARLCQLVMPPNCTIRGFLNGTFNIGFSMDSKAMWELGIWNSSSVKAPNQDTCCIIDPIDDVIVLRRRFMSE